MYTCSVYKIMLHTDLQPAEKLQMLCNSESIKQYIVLRADTQVMANLIHVS